MLTIHSVREWLSGGASPCQGEGRGFDPRLALFILPFLLYSLVFHAATFRHLSIIDFLFYEFLLTF